VGVGSRLNSFTQASSYVPLPIVRLARSAVWSLVKGERMKRFKVLKVCVFVLGLLVLGLPTAYAEFVSTSPVQSKEFDDLGWLGWVGLLGILGLLGRLYRSADKPTDKTAKPADRNIVVGEKHR
jgi:hypothetical protein